MTTGMTELQHHKEVTQWLKRAYPKVIFRTDYSAGLKLTPGQARMQKKMQSGDGYPDLFIAKPHGDYSGLYIELKALNTGLVLKDGSLTTSEHPRKQFGVLMRLSEAGYAATFAEGHTEAKAIIKAYFKGEKIYPHKYLTKKPVDKSEDDEVF